MTESPMITGTEICRGFMEMKLRNQAAEDEKVVRILGCPTIVKRSRIEMAALKAGKAIAQALRGARPEPIKDAGI